MLDSFRELYRYRSLISELTLRTLRLRYRGSVLGVFWTLLNPLLFMGLYTLVFTVFLKSAIPNFPLYLLCGLIPFTFFTTSIQQGSSSIIDGRSYVGKTLFPTVVLTVVPVLANAVNFLIAISLVFVLAIAFRVHFGWGLLLLPVIFAIQLLFTQALATMLATATVFFRDVRDLLDYATSALLFLTPLFYRPTDIPHKYAGIALASPLAALTDSYQRIFYYGTMPDFSRLAYAFVAAVLLALVSNAIFARYRESFAQYL